MHRKGKILSLVLIVLILISLSLAGGAFYLFQKEKVENLALQDELGSVKTKAKIIENRLEDKEKTVSQLEAQLRESKSQVEFLGSELEKEKKLNQDTITQLEQLKVDLEAYKKNKAEAQQKLAQSQEELNKLQAQLKNLEDKKAKLENKVKEMEEAKEQKVELGTIVVGQQEPVAAESPAPQEKKNKAPQQPTSSLGGKILVVNKDYNFAVINLGSKDGVNINDIFSVYHKNKYLGDIKIEKVHDSMSAANFVSPDIKDKVREGDKVTIKNK